MLCDVEKPEETAKTIVDKIAKIYNNKIKFSPGKDSYITLKLESNSNKVIIDEAKRFLIECEKI